MSHTEKEIFEQHVALRQTFAYMQGSSEKIKDFFAMSGFYSLTFTGCGGAYALCRSAELSMKIRGGLTTMSYAGGDLTLNMPYYQDMLNGTLLIAVSRSGQTSETIKAVQLAQNNAGACVIAVTGTENSKLSQIADLSLEMPWVFDEGCASTRCMSCLFMCNLYLIGLLSGDNLLLDEIRDAIDNQESFMNRYAAELEGIGQSGAWDKIIVLADGELAGVADCGAITMRRMCNIQASHCNILDVRHGEVVGIDDRTLVIAVVSPVDDAYQSVLLRELRDFGAKIMTISSKEENVFGGELNVCLPEYQNYAVRGLPLLFSLQAIGYYKCVGDGKNPDETKRVNNWVRL